MLVSTKRDSCCSERQMDRQIDRIENWTVFRQMNTKYMDTQTAGIILTVDGQTDWETNRETEIVENLLYR